MSINLPEQALENTRIDQDIFMSKQGYQDLIKSTGGKNIHWTTDINAELPIKFAEAGTDFNSITPDTIPLQIMRTAKLRGDSPAMRVMRNGKEHMWTWSQYYEQIIGFAKGLA